jgi:pyridoxal phosphate enzyme (YggS family)
MSISEQLFAVRQQLAEAVAAAGRPKESVELLAVSKTHSSKKIIDAYNSGQRSFGENYADELIEKSEELAAFKDLRFVFIGQLQSNKIQKVVKHAAEIQSVATEKHSRYIERYAQELGKEHYPVWSVVNAGDESSKQGTTFGDLPQLSTFIQTHCPHLSLQGIMAIPPQEYSDEMWLKQVSNKVPELYQQLAEMAKKTGAGKLSLGMSGDLRLAVAAGSHCVRIGTAIFGARELK